MSLVVLKNGDKFSIENPIARESILRQRSRKTITLVFLNKAEEDFAAIKDTFSQKENTERLIVYYPDVDESLSDKQLAGVAHEVFEGYTILGNVTNEEVVMEEGTPDAPPVYGRKLTIELGQRQYGEE